ncbi:MAG TPA: hypothetical protein VGI79_12445 [Caulobacteraceae bacterium]|jgi:TonB family protein
MNKLLIAALMTATLGSTAQAATTPQDQAWIGKMASAVNDTLSQSTESVPKVGVVYVPMTVDAKGHAQVAAPPQSCGCPDLDQAAVDALNSMGTAPRPPADLAGKPFMVKVVFKAPQTHGDLSQAYGRCG